MEVTTTKIERERRAPDRRSGAFVLFGIAPVKACPRNVRTVRPPKRRSRRATGSSSPPPLEWRGVLEEWPLGLTARSD
jgi:hypothetical protein